MIIGAGALAVKGAQAASLGLIETFSLIRDDWNGYNVLHLAAARMGGLMIGYALPGGIADVVSAAPRLLILLGADEVDIAPFADCFKLYIGHHGDRGAAGADLILPGAAYSEKHGIYVNLEGRVQSSEKAVDPPGDAREDWSILRALSDVVGKPLPFDTFHQLREALFADHPEFGKAGLVDYEWAPPVLETIVIPKGSGVRLPINDFYLTNPIARASPTMQLCSTELLHGNDLRRRRNDRWFRHRLAKLWLADRHDHPHSDDRLAVMLAWHDHLRRPQDLGGHGLRRGPNVVGHSDCCKLWSGLKFFSRRHHPVIAIAACSSCSDHHLHGRASGLGVIPFGPGPGDS